MYILALKKCDTLLNYEMFNACVVRENQVHEVIRLRDQTSWGPQHWTGHGGEQQF